MGNDEGAGSGDEAENERQLDRRHSPATWNFRPTRERSSRMRNVSSESGCDAAQELDREEYRRN